MVVNDDNAWNRLLLQLACKFSRNFWHENGWMEMNCLVKDISCVMVEHNKGWKNDGVHLTRTLVVLGYLMHLRPCPSLSLLPTIIMIQNSPQALNTCGENPDVSLNVCCVYSVESVSYMQSIASIIRFVIYGVECVQLSHSSFDTRKNICALPLSIINSDI